MIKSIFILFLFLNGITNSDNQLKNKEKDSITIHHEYYDLSIKITPLNNDFNLIIEIKPIKGSYFVSPNEKKCFSGKFHMDLGSYKDVEFMNGLVEFPQSKAEYGPKLKTFAKGVKYVYQKSTYTQKLKIKNKKDFKVFGRIQFTIEPSCTFEEIPFAINYVNRKINLFMPKC